MPHFAAAMGQGWRMVRALTRHDGLALLDQADGLPAPARLLRALTKPKQAVSGTPGAKLARALTDLGPTHIKLGQFLATRADLVGPGAAADLGQLQDRLAPFAQRQAEEQVEQALGRPLTELFDSFGPPVAAASVAQVHFAEKDGRLLAVKILRPGIENAMRADLDVMAWGARLLERFVPSSRRLKPVEVVAMLRASVEQEMDLRIEAAAASELKANMAGEAGFAVPAVDWDRTAKRVLTLDRVIGIPLTGRAGLDQAGLDRPKLARTVIQSFLRQAMRDGFFHADLHHGNLFVTGEGVLTPVDFGIMGRLDKANRRHLARILHGFLTRDYRRTAEVHFDAGWVPHDQNVDAFAQALRAVGEPIFGRTSDQISMGGLLAQLFEITATFNMAARPELVLLQKTMVVVEGVARDLDPGTNIWDAAAPVVEEWLRDNLGPEAVARDLLETLRRLAETVPKLPGLIDRLDRTLAER